MKIRKNNEGDTIYSCSMCNTEMDILELWYLGEPFLNKHYCNPFTPLVCFCKKCYTKIKPNGLKRKKLDKRD